MTYARRDFYNYYEGVNALIAIVSRGERMIAARDRSVSRVVDFVLAFEPFFAQK